MAKAAVADKEERKTIEQEEPQGVILAPPPDANSIAQIVKPVNPSEQIVTNRDISHLPEFTTQEVASIFFQRSAGWLRWIDRRGLLYKDATGRTVEVKRLGDPINGMKRYTLADIETIARILHQNDVISPSRMIIALQLVHLIALGYNAIPVE